MKSESKIKLIIKASFLLSCVIVIAVLGLLKKEFIDMLWYLLLTYNALSIAILTDFFKKFSTKKMITSAIIHTVIIILLMAYLLTFNNYLLIAFNVLAGFFIITALLLSNQFGKVQVICTLKELNNMVKNNSGKPYFGYNNFSVFIILTGLLALIFCNIKFAFVFRIILLILYILLVLTLYILKNDKRKKLGHNKNCLIAEFVAVAFHAILIFAFINISNIYDMGLGSLVYLMSVMGGVYYCFDRDVLEFAIKNGEIKK